jgi:hypothetical protein
VRLVEQVPSDGMHHLDGPALGSLEQALQRVEPELVLLGAPHHPGRLAVEPHNLGVLKKEKKNKKRGKKNSSE